MGPEGFNPEKFDSMNPSEDELAAARAANSVEAESDEALRLQVLKDFEIAKVPYVSEEMIQKAMDERKNPEQDLAA
jgi:hypothetical protein